MQPRRKVERRPVFHYYTLSNDIDERQQPLQTWRYDVYEVYQDGLQTHWTTGGPVQERGIEGVIFSRGGLPNREMAEQLCRQDCLSRGIEAGYRETAGALDDATV